MSSYRSLLDRKKKNDRWIGRCKPTSVNPFTFFFFFLSIYGFFPVFSIRFFQDST